MQGNSTDIAWAAGFIDGEGSIGIYASNRSYSLTLYAGGKGRAPLDKLSSIFGGKPYWNKSKGDKGNGLWDWKLHGTNAVAALEAMLPYLTVKREQAVLAIEFQSVLQSNYSRLRLTEADISLRKQYYTSMKDMKVSQYGVKF